MPTRRRRGVAPSSFYSLTDVVQKIDDGHVFIRSNAQTDALRQFGWELPDIEDAYRRLKPSHFLKTAPSIYKPGVYLDFYEATIDGERIYTHFYIDHDGLLVINSFHRP